MKILKKKGHTCWPYTGGDGKGCNAAKQPEVVVTSECKLRIRRHKCKYKQVSQRYHHTIQDGRQEWQSEPPSLMEDILLVTL